MNTNQYKLNLQKKIVSISIVLTILKFTAYFITMSVGILTDSLESIINVIAGFISLYSLYLSTKPKDENHPYGHGKIEMLSASTEGILILLAGMVIIYEAINRFFFPVEITKIDIGLVIVALAGLVNYIMGYYSIRTGKKQQSMALIASGKHLQSDTYSTIGLVIGLIIILLTGKIWIDSIIAIVFGLFIGYTGIKILRQTSSELMDATDFKLLEKIKKIILDNKKENWVDVHDIKLIKYGETVHIDLDLRLPWYYNIKEAHDESIYLQSIIKKEFQEKADLTIHIDYCYTSLCSNCLLTQCPKREREFLGERVWTFKKEI